MPPMIRAIPATSAPHNSWLRSSKLVFWAPLVGYWLLAIQMAFHPQPPWVVVILGSPLILVAFAINYRALRKPARNARHLRPV